MKYIQFFLFYILTIHNSLFANDDIENLCKKFSIHLQQSEISLNINDDTSFKSGVLWKVITPRKKTNYLFGTIHSQDYTVSKIPSDVSFALTKSKKLILEIIPNNEANLIYLNEMYFKNGERLDKLLEKTLFRKFVEQAKQYNLSNKELNNIKYMKPWAAFNLIGRPKPTRAPTLESNLLKFAKQEMMEIDSLENMSDIISSLEKLPIDDQLNILKDTICNRKYITNDTKMLINFYINRDAIAILNLTNKKHFDESVYDRYMQEMLHNRNSQMLKKISGEFEKGNVFVAVGILHLISKHGLLEKLYNQGYVIEEIY